MATNPGFDINIATRRFDIAFNIAGNIHVTADNFDIALYRGIDIDIACDTFNITFDQARGTKLTGNNLDGLAAALGVIITPQDLRAGDTGKS